MTHQAMAEELLEAIGARFYLPEAGLYREYYPSIDSDRPFAPVWPFTAVLSAANAVLRLPGQRERYEAHLRDLLDGLEKYWAAPGYMSYPPSAGGGDRYYDDNEWIGLELLAAHDVLREGRLFERAIALFQFVTGGWSDDLGGGLYWREGARSTKNACSNGPAIVLALELYRRTGEQQYLDWALRIYGWLNARLRGEDGLFRDHVRTDGSVDVRVFSYNTGSMIHANALLYGITGFEMYRVEAETLAEASLSYFGEGGGETRFFPATPWFNAVLFRGYLALRSVGGNGGYVDELLDAAHNGFEHARDRDGLVNPDWSGRSGPGRQSVLEQGGTAEILALAAVADAGGSLTCSAAGDVPGLAGKPPGNAAYRALSPLGTEGECREFDRGGICVTKPYGLLRIPVEFFAYYQKLGGPAGYLGFPVAQVAAALPSSAGTSGLLQRFEGSDDYSDEVLSLLGDALFGATVYWSDKFGAVATWFEIGAAFERAGSTAGQLGFPVSEREPAGKSPRGSEGYFQRFEHGYIYWAPGVGAYPLWGAVLAAHSALGGVSGVLGFPMSGESRASRSRRGTEGVFQRFEGLRPYEKALRPLPGEPAPGATVYWSARTGARATWGPVGEQFEQQGGTGGRLGFPVSDLHTERVAGETILRQHFEGGSIVIGRAHASISGRLRPS